MISIPYQEGKGFFFAITTIAVVTIYRPVGAGWRLPMLVVNCRTRREGDPRVFYCGRTFAGWTGSPLGNPCSIPNKKCPICSRIHFGPGMKLLTPCRSIPCYKRWLWNEIQQGRLIDLIQSIPVDAELGCWCAPDPCHCDIIIAARAWLDQRG